MLSITNVANRSHLAAMSGSLRNVKASVTCPIVPVRTPVMMTVGVKLSLLIWTALIWSNDAVKVAAAAGGGTASNKQVITAEIAILRIMDPRVGW